MSSTLIYKQPVAYEAAMVLLYGRHYAARYQAVSNLIPDGASVLDVCCGPAVLWHRYLRARGIEYFGLDMSESFIRSLKIRGGHGEVWDATDPRPLPPADYVVMQASLCHFLPDAAPMVDRLLVAARERVIVAEPVRNLTTSPNPVLSWLGRRFTDPGNGRSGLRFNPQTLEALFSRYAGQTVAKFPIPGGREMVYVLRSGAADGHRQQHSSYGA